MFTRADLRKDELCHCCKTQLTIDQDGEFHCQCTTGECEECKRCLEAMEANRN